MRPRTRKLDILNASATGGGGGGGGGLLEGGGTWETIGANTADSGGVTVVAGGGANVKGSYAEVVAATSTEATGVLVNVTRTYASDRRWALDIAVGAAGSEVVQLANLTFISDSRTQADFNVFFPNTIPSGSRVSARCQSSSAGSGFDVACALLTGNSADALTTDTINFNTADSGGTSILLDSVAVNVKTSYVELTAATTADYTGVILLINPFVASASLAQMLLDIAVGAEGEESDVLSNIAFAVSADTDTANVQIGPIPIDTIPSGSRIAARLQSSVVGASDGARVQVLGVR